LGENGETLPSLSLASRRRLGQNKGGWRFAEGKTRLPAILGDETAVPTTHLEVVD